MILERNLITPDQLSEKLQVPRSWIYARTRETGPDSMPKIKVGKYLRFHLNEVLDWIEERNERI